MAWDPSNLGMSAAGESENLCVRSPGGDTENPRVSAAGTLGVSRSG